MRHRRVLRSAPPRPVVALGAAAVVTMLATTAGLAHGSSATRHHDLSEAASRPSSTLVAAPTPLVPAAPALGARAGQPWTSSHPSATPKRPAETSRSSLRTVTVERPESRPESHPGKRPAAKVATTSAATPAASTGWTGYAFDTCSAPSQRVMSRWLRHSPFTGVGIYLGGVQRACGQHNLTRTWVHRQTAEGWKLLPLWVGPQASCTGFHHRIPSSAADHYGRARYDGALQARYAASAARHLGIGHGQLLFYDLESFDAGRASCVRPALTFLEGWTTRLHQLGYESGVYSHVDSGIKLLTTTPKSYHRPDAVWYAWIHRADARPTKYISAPGFMRTHRVHQFALDERARFGGIRLDIDWNYVSFGSTSAKTPLLKVGARGASVRRLQQQLNATLRTHVPVDGSFGHRTARAVKRFQARLGRPQTSVVTRSIWHSLAHLLR